MRAVRLRVRPAFSTSDLPDICSTPRSDRRRSRNCGRLGCRTRLLSMKKRIPRKRQLRRRLRLRNFPRACASVWKNVACSLYIKIWNSHWSKCWRRWSRRASFSTARSLRIKEKRREKSLQRWKRKSTRWRGIPSTSILRNSLRRFYLRSLGCPPKKRRKAVFRQTRAYSRICAARTRSLKNCSTIAFGRNSNPRIWTPWAN